MFKTTLKEKGHICTAAKPCHDPMVTPLQIKPVVRKTGCANGSCIPPYQKQLFFSSGQKKDPVVHGLHTQKGAETKNLRKSLRLPRLTDLAPT